MLPTWVAALAACLPITAACADLGAIDETREDRNTFPFSGTHLTVDNAGAELRVVTGAIGAIEVERSLTGKATLDGNASWSLEDASGGSDATLRLGIVTGARSNEVSAARPRTSGRST